MRAAGVVLMLAAMAVPRPAHPQGPSGSVAVVGVGVEDFTPGSGGTTLSADWIATQGRGSFRAGLESVANGSVSWVVARVGAGWWMTSRLLADAVLTFGPGSWTGDRFWYRQARAGVSYALVPGRWYLEGEGLAFSIAPIQGRIVSAATTLVPHRRLSARLGYGRSVGGTYRAEYGVIRADLRTRVVGAIGGFAVGRSGATAQELLSAEGRREVFAGVVVPAGRVELTAILSHTWSDAVRRESVVLITRIPLR